MGEDVGTVGFAVVGEDVGTVGFAVVGEDVAIANAGRFRPERVRFALFLFM